MDELDASNTPANGDGRSTSPFNLLAGLNSSSAAGDYLYVFTGSGNYGGGLVLKANQTLIGQGVALIVGGFTLNPAGTRPTITNTSGDAITLNANNTIGGLNVTTGGAALNGINGTSVGNLTINNVSISGAGQAVNIVTGALNVTLDSISTTSSTGRGVNLDSVSGTFTGNGGAIAGTTGSGFRVDAGTAVISYAGSINVSTSHSVEVTNRTGGSASFSGAISDTGTGISLTSNTGSTISFSGSISASTGANPAFSATGGGTVNVTGSSNVLTTTTATALNVANTTIGASGITFRSIASNGAASGIALNNTGASGGLSVTGVSTAGSGGTVQNSTADGISLLSTSNVSLSYMNITNNSVNGLYGNQLTNFTIANSSVTNNNTSVTPLKAGLEFGNLLGTCAINSMTVNGTKGNNIYLNPTSGTLTNLTISGLTIGPNPVGTGANGLSLVTNGSGVNVTITVNGSSLFTGNQASGFLTTINSGAAATINISNSTFQDNNINVDLGSSAGGTQLINVLNNTLLRSASNDINIVATGKSMVRLAGTPSAMAPPTPAHATLMTLPSATAAMWRGGWRSLTITCRTVISRAFSSKPGR